jgi:monomeric sarcosine oxidase
VSRVAVVGAGGIGSGAAYWLSQAGHEVHCFEQFGLNHGRGASEDHSRIIRLGYHAERYTSLAPASYAAWEHLERASGVSLVHRTGMVNLAPAGSPGVAILDAYGEAMAAADIAFERLDAEETMRRWPQFRLEDGTETVFQADGGVLDIRKGVAVQLALARAAGATLHAHTPVEAIEETASGVRLSTATGRFEADRLVLCAGAWTARLLEDTLGVRWPIRLTQEQVTYYATTNLRDFAPERFPIWIWHGEREFYGFPVHGEVATKAAEDLGGPEVALEERSWDADPVRVRDVAAFAETILPGYTGPELYTRCCLYDMPPDRDFVVDVLPGHERIAVCVGAGHAAKFASVLGSILADLVTDGGTRHPIAAFRADRPALMDPAFAPNYRLGPEAVAG